MKVVPGSLSDQSNLGLFFRYTSPRVPVAHSAACLAQGGEEGAASLPSSPRAEDGGAGGSECGFPLTDLWAFYDEPYGFDVPIMLNGRGTEVHYVPHLSAIQLFRRARRADDAEQVMRKMASVLAHDRMPATAPVPADWAAGNSAGAHRRRYSSGASAAGSMLSSSSGLMTRSGVISPVHMSNGIGAKPPSPVLSAYDSVGLRSVASSDEMTADLGELPSSLLRAGPGSSGGSNFGQQQGFHRANPFSPGGGPRIGGSGAAGIGMASHPDDAPPDFLPLPPPPLPGVVLASNVADTFEAFPPDKQVVFEWFESDTPDRRLPLAQKVEQLRALGDASGETPFDASLLGSLDSRDLDPRSWYAVQWLPILCHAHTRERIRGSFVTYHLLMSSDTGELPLFGYLPFKIRPETWYREQGATGKYRAPVDLVRSPSVWLKLVNRTHPDREHIMRAGDPHG